MTDAEAFLRGDPLAIDEVRDAVEVVVRSFQIADSATNKDLVQDALTRILSNLSARQFQGRSSLKTYARRVARYTCLEYLRRRRFEAAIDPDSVPSRARWSRPDDSLLWTEEHLHNLAIFSSLPSDCRELLKMVIVEGLSYEEIGKRLGLSKGAVKVRVFRCRMSFRRAAGLKQTIPARSATRKDDP